MTLLSLIGCALCVQKNVTNEKRSHQTPSEEKKNPFVGVANLGALLTLDTLPTRKPVSEKH